MPYPPVPDHKGEKNPKAKLTEAKVREIKTLLAEYARRKAEAEQVGPAYIAKKFNVSEPTVRQIKTGRIWSHVK